MRTPAVCSLLAVASTAIAQPIVVDNPSFGPGSITFDPSQNLAFLDLTVTSNLSHAAMQTELMPGGAYEDWRYATRSEVVAFVNSFGWSPPLSDQTQGAQIDGPIGRTIIDDYIGLTGAINGISDSAAGFLENEDAIWIWFYEDFGLQFSGFNLIGVGTLGSFNAGHWLVRESTPSYPTYQGRLAESGTVVDGDADFRATLFSRWGFPLETIEHTNVPVLDGLFTVPLSFDPALFEIPDAMLRFEVRAPSGVGAYEAVNADQPLSPAPNAMFARRASTADSADVAMTLNNETTIALPLNAGTAPYGVGYSDPIVTRSGNLVVLNGLVGDTGISNDPETAFATLPAGFRPNARLLFLQASSAGIYRVDVLPSGDIVFQDAPGVGGPMDWVSLDGISFPIE